MAYSKSKEEHEVHLKLVLESLRKEKLYAKFSNSEFWLEEVHFLANVVGDALSRKERVKSRRVRGMILAAQSEAFKQENVLLVGSVMDEAHASRYLVHPGVDNRLQCQRLLACCNNLRYLSENEIESPWILSLNFQGQSSEYDVIWVMYPQADGQSERMIRALEDIMRACVIDFGSSYHLSIRCAPFEDLYGRKCRSPVLWAEIREISLTGLELVQETTDKVVLVKEKPKAARVYQKSYVDYRRKPLEFEVGDRVLLKVTPWKGVVCFGKKGKLAPRYVGPFEFLERIGLVAYRLRLPEELNSVHDTFHVSNLKKCLADATLHVPLNKINVDKTLRFIEEPVKIMDREIKKLKRKNITLVKVRWNLKCGPEFTWEHEDQMRIKYPQLFVDRVVEPAS
ncbi:putative reverse transcriptase domain-containing protein [Tanacetum coccineum]